MSESTTGRLRQLRGCVIVISDRVVAGERENVGGPAAIALLQGSGLAISASDMVVIPEDEAQIRAHMAAAIQRGYRVIFTIGGTGLNARNTTPEVTREFVHRELPGVATHITVEGLKTSDRAGLSRGIVGVTADGALICNAPGSTGGVRDAARVLAGLLRPIFRQLDEE